MPDEIEPTESTPIVDTSESSPEVTAEPAEMFAVKIDGDEQQVTLSELQDGYSRQADYTRKTQELASERQRLEQYEAIGKALEADPAATLEALATAFGVEDSTIKNVSTESEDDWTMDDPQTKRIEKLESQLKVQEQTQRQQGLEKEISGLKEQYGEFDEQELFSHALKNQIPNLEAAYTHMKFSEVVDKKKQLEEEVERVSAKREAAVVEGGSTRQAGSVVGGLEGKTPSSIRDAFLQAKQQLGA